MPGSTTARIGGNTACVSVEADGTILVLDGGTGIFFAPLYERDRRIDVVDFVGDGVRHSPLEPLDGVHFPIHARDLPARCVTADGQGEALLLELGFEVHRHAVNHPGGAVGFRIRHGGADLVYMTDNEIDPPAGAAASFEALADFCRQADVLCHDAQYLPGEHTDRWGWGHSSLPGVCDLAIAAEVGHLVLFHHDPDRTDAEIADMERQARERLEPSGILCTAAYEGLSLEL